MTFGELYGNGVANGRRVAMARRVLYGDKQRARQELYRVLHECRERPDLPADVCWRAVTYGAGFQQGWSLGWAAAGELLQRHGQPEGLAMRIGA